MPKADRWGTPTENARWHCGWMSPTDARLSGQPAERRCRTCHHAEARGESRRFTPLLECVRPNQSVARGADPVNAGCGQWTARLPNKGAIDA